MNSVSPKRRRRGDGYPKSPVRRLLSAAEQILTDSRMHNDATRRGFHDGDSRPVILRHGDLVRLYAAWREISARERTKKRREETMDLYVS